jgi:hypothetical protein
LDIKQQPPVVETGEGHEMSKDLPRETLPGPDANELERRRLRKLILGKKRRRQQIDARTVPGKQAYDWARWALAQKGASITPLDRQLIKRGKTLLFTATSLELELLEDAKARGRLSNGRTRKLTSLYFQIDQAFGEFRRINEQLGLDKPAPIDLASILTQQGAKL